MASARIGISRLQLPPQEAFPGAQGLWAGRARLGVDSEGPRVGSEWAVRGWRKRAVVLVLNPVGIIGEIQPPPNNSHEWRQWGIFKVSLYLK